MKKIRKWNEVGCGSINYLHTNHFFIPILILLFCVSLDAQMVHFSIGDVEDDHDLTSQSCAQFEAMMNNGHVSHFYLPGNGVYGPNPGHSSEWWVDIQWSRQGFSYLNPRGGTITFPAGFTITAVRQIGVPFVDNGGIEFNGNTLVLPDGGYDGENPTMDPAGIVCEARITVAPEVHGLQTVSYNFDFDYSDLPIDWMPSQASDLMFIGEYIPPIDLAIIDYSCTPVMDDMGYSIQFTGTIKNQGYTSFLTRAQAPEINYDGITDGINAWAVITFSHMGTANGMGNTEPNAVFNLGVFDLLPQEEASFFCSFHPNIDNCDYTVTPLTVNFFIEPIGGFGNPYLESSVDRPNNLRYESIQLEINTPVRPYPWPLEETNEVHTINAIPGEYRGTTAGEHSHKGVDIQATDYDNVIAVHSGTVSQVGADFVKVQNLGNYNSQTTYFIYKHTEPTVFVEDRVTTCDEDIEVNNSIGCVVEGAHHLHFNDFSYGPAHAANPLQGGLNPPVTSANDHHSPTFSTITKFKFLRHDQNIELNKDNLSGNVDIVVYVKDINDMGVRIYPSKLAFSLSSVDPENPSDPPDPIYIKDPAVDISGILVYGDDAIGHHTANTDDDDGRSLYCIELCGCTDVHPQDSEGYIGYYLTNENINASNSPVDMSESGGIDFDELINNTPGASFGVYNLNVIAYDYVGNEASTSITITIDQSAVMGE